MSNVGLGEIVILLLLIVPLVLLLPTIFYLLTLQRAFQRCAPEVRTMTPALVWLQLIPGFNLVWHFFLVVNLGKSLGAEFDRRQLPHEPRPGQSIGLAMCILSCGVIVPFLGVLAGIASLVCWIAYWMAIARWSAQLAGAPGATTATA